MILAIAGYAVAVSCILTYVYAASGRSLTPNLWANLIGGPIVAFGNALVGYWPAVILEVFFTLAGLYGLLRLWWKKPVLWMPWTKENLDEVWEWTYTPIGINNIRVDMPNLEEAKRKARQRVYGDYEDE